MVGDGLKINTVLKNNEFTAFYIRKIPREILVDSWSKEVFRDMFELEKLELDMFIEPISNYDNKDQEGKTCTFKVCTKNYEDCQIVKSRVTQMIDKYLPKMNP